ncbi:unnamed protein product [Phytophthora fragariaefolia]|uniref:Unnamed protein product n=1 Tax=Phytophthora fragariaefolia TaxID=1490495 RepID=A0A9W7CNP2_9STRA|nr:unnamed protein product [Phytophthora fragariaefolia]
MVFIQGRFSQERYSNDSRSSPTAKNVTMASLTPTRTKTTTKSEKTKRVTRRRTMDTLARSDGDDEEDGGRDLATTQHEAKAETPHDVTEAVPTQAERQDEVAAVAAPATEVAALVSALYQLTTVVVGLQARVDEDGRPTAPRLTSNEEDKVAVTRHETTTAGSHTEMEERAAAPELAAMATAVGRLAVMVARLQPAEGSGEPTGQQPVGHERRQRVVLVRPTSGAPYDGGSSDSDKNYSDNSDDDSTAGGRSDENGSDEDGSDGIVSNDGSDEEERVRRRRSV